MVYLMVTDDTALFYKADTIAALKKYIQHDILMLRMWFNDNYMIMSPETKLATFGPNESLILHNRFTIPCYR